MNDIMNFLVENYIYVAAGSLFVIVVLIGFLVSSGKKRKKVNSNPDMVSMSDIQTGSIDEVSNNLGNQDNMQPLNISELSQNQSVNSTNQGPIIMPSDSMEGSSQFNDGFQEPIETVNSALNVASNEMDVPAQEVQPEFSVNPFENTPLTEMNIPVENVQPEEQADTTMPVEDFGVEVNPVSTLDNLNDREEVSPVPNFEIKQETNMADETEIMDFMDVEENVNEEPKTNEISSAIDRDDTQTF